MSGWKEEGSSGQVRKWGEKGDSVEGILSGIRESLLGYSPLGVIGEYEVPLKGYVGREETAKVVRRIAFGSLVKIVFEGQVTTKSGKQANVFKVYSQPPPAGAPTTQTEGDDEKEPF